MEEPSPPAFAWVVSWLFDPRFGSAGASWEGTGCSSLPAAAGLRRLDGGFIQEQVFLGSAGMESAHVPTLGSFGCGDGNGPVLVSYRSESSPGERFPWQRPTLARA